MSNQNVVYMYIDRYLKHVIIVYTSERYTEVVNDV